MKVRFVDAFIGVSGGVLIFAFINWLSNPSYENKETKAPVKVVEKKPAPLESVEKESSGPYIAPEPKANTYFATCADAEAAGHWDIKEDEAGYRSALDRDNDGIACES